MSKLSDASVSTRGERYTTRSSSPKIPTPRSTDCQSGISTSFCNSISGISSPRNQFFSFEGLTSDGMMSKVNDELVSLIASLSTLMESESLWPSNLPDMSQLNVQEKINYANWLARNIYKYVSTTNLKEHKIIKVIICKKDKMSQQKSVDATFIHNKMGIFSKIFKNKNGVALSQKEANDFAALLIGSIRDSAYEDIENKAKEYEKKYRIEENNLDHYMRKLNDIKDDQERLILTNSYLKAEVKKFKQCIKLLQQEIHQNKKEINNREELIADTRRELRYTNQFIHLIRKGRN